MFAEATKKAASARFRQPQLDAEGQQIEVRTESLPRLLEVGGDIM